MFETWAASLAGLAIGGVIGAAVLLTNFCALGGIADILFARDWRRFRAWVLAAGVAIVGAHTLDATGFVPLDRAISLAPQILWLPALLGGVLFGFGMALGGGCISRGLARAGAGSLKSLAIIAVIGLSAAATMTWLAPLQAVLGRTAVLETFGPGGVHRIFGNLPFIGAETVRWIFVALFGGGALWFALKDAWFRHSRDHVLGGLSVGLMVVAAWFVAGRLFETSGAGAFTAVNFVPPLGEAVLAFTGCVDHVGQRFVERPLAGFSGNIPRRFPYARRDSRQFVEPVRTEAREVAHVYPSPVLGIPARHSRIAGNSLDPGDLAGL
jgi:uncharacterized membrane protein YedE/YeeE